MYVNGAWSGISAQQTNQIPPLDGNQSETPSYLQFKLSHFIYPHKETNIVIPKIESKNMAFIVSHQKPIIVLEAILDFRAIHLLT